MANVVEVSGISDELLTLVDARWRECHNTDRSEYIRDLIRRDLVRHTGVRMGDETLSEAMERLFGPVRDDVERLGFSEEEVVAVSLQVQKEARAEIRAKREKAASAQAERAA